MIDKSCRTCKHFRYGECTAAEDNFSIEAVSKLNDTKSNDALRNDLKEILEGELKKSDSLGSDGHFDRTEFVINRIVRAVRDMEIHQPEQIEVRPKDYNSFYCSKYE